MICSPNLTPKRVDTVEFHARAVQRVISRIRLCLDEGITLREMAAVAHMSPYHFIRTFRQVTGVPPRRFLSALRVEAATRMLLETDNSVTAICLDVGYSSLGTFIRRFSYVLGVSPSKLRVSRKSSVKGLLTQPGNSLPSMAANASQGIRGRIQAPASFAGAIFIGLFSTPIPEGKPVACVISFLAGDYFLTPVPQGRYYLFALGIPWPNSVGDYFRHESALRGGGQLITVGTDVLDCEEISLRPALSTDPPILINLPTLLKKAPIQQPSQDSIAVGA
jgi:AraC family transcriptional regulator